MDKQIYVANEDIVAILSKSRLRLLFGMYKLILKQTETGQYLNTLCSVPLCQSLKKGRFAKISFSEEAHANDIVITLSHHIVEYMGYIMCYSILLSMNITTRI